MKRFTKVCLILAAVFAVLGIGFLSGGIVAGATFGGLRQAFMDGDFTFGKVSRTLQILEMSDDTENMAAADGGRKEAGVYDAEDIRKLKLDVKYGNITLLPAEDGKIRVETENAGTDLECGADGHELKIKGNSRRLKNADIRIWIPAGNVLEKAELDLDAAALTVEDFSAEDLEISIGAGQMRADGVLAAEKLSVEVGAGEMRIEELDCSRIELDCGLGSMDVRAAGSQADYSYEISCGMGEIRIGDETYNSFAGEKEVRTQGSRGELKASCGMGSIRVDFTE